MTEEIELTGSALAGLAPQTISTLTDMLPKKVKLGRQKPRPGQQALRLSAFYDPHMMASPPPTSINRRDKAAASLAKMYLNDRYGCCVISGKGHMFGLMTGADSDSGGIALMTDNEVYQQYQSFCGPGDNGCNIQDVLDRIKSGGFVMNGKRHVIDGYVQADWRNKLEVMVAQYIFGATTIGINLPQAWTNSAVWDVTSSRIVGGHDVTPIDYDQDGVYVSSWGRIYMITWAAFVSTRWLEEYWVVLSPDWYGNDKLAPSGFDVNGLRKALSQIGSGVVPDPTPPTPVPPSPTPPPTPGPTPTPGTYSKTIVLRCNSPISVEIRPS